MARRTSIDLWLDGLALLAMIGLAITGGLIRWVLPAGTGRSLQLFGLSRHDIGGIHFWLAVVTVAVLAVHLCRHWTWVCAALTRGLGAGAPSPKARAAWGLGLLLGLAVLIGGGLWWASGQVEHTRGTMEAPGWGRQTR